MVATPAVVHEVVVPEYKVRVARDHDIAEIANIVTAAYYKREIFRKEGYDRLRAHEITDPNHWVILVEISEPEKDETLISALKCNLNAQNQVWIHMFATRVEYQGKGLGSKLFKVIENEAKNRQIEKLFLRCIDTPNLVTYYEKLGFKKTTNYSTYDPAYLKEEYIGKIYTVEMVKNLSKSNDH